MSITSLTKGTRMGRPFFKEFPDRLERLKDYVPNQRQLGWMKFINLHGPVSSLYLFEFDKLRGLRNYGSVKKLLNELWRAGFISRPKQQSAAVNSKYNYLVYDLTPKGFKFLKDVDEWENALRPECSSWVHLYMTACITASIHISCLKEGYRYIPAHEILKDNPISCDVSFKWKGNNYTKKLVPDSIFAIDYGDSFIAYVVEADRNTEANSPKTPHRKSAERSIKQYQNFSEMYREHYGLKAPMVVLTITTSSGHLYNCLDIVNEQVGPCFYMAFGLAQDFGFYWKPPELLTHLFTDGLKRNGKPDWIIKK